MNHLQKYDTVFESSSKTEVQIQQDIEDYFMDIIDLTGAETTIELRGYLEIDFKDRARAGHPGRDHNFKDSEIREAKHKTYLFKLSIEDKIVESDKILKCYNKLEKDEEYFTFEFRLCSRYEIDEFLNVSGEIFIDFYVVERPKKK